MTRYPPGTSAGDPNAPWNQPEPPTCSECGEYIDRGDDHDGDCPDYGTDAVELRERRESHAMDAEFERRRDR